MEEVETVLARRAEALGVEIKRGLATTDFHQTEDGVTVAFGDQSFQSQWLVGCDGGRSVVRKVGGLNSPVQSRNLPATRAHVDLVDPEKLSPGRNMTPTGMYLQSQPGCLVIQDFDGGTFQGADKPVTLEHAQEVPRRISNTDVTTLP